MTSAAKIPSVHSAWLADHRDALVRALPADATDKQTKKHLSDAWRAASAEDRKAYADRRRALVRAAAAKPPKSALPPGWRVEDIGGRRAWTHPESGALYWRKPLNLQRVRAGVARRGAGPGAYASFVKDNYKELGSLAACAKAWKAAKAAKAAASVGGDEA